MHASTDAIGDLLGRLVPPNGAATGERTLVGLVGRGIQASRTPTMHEREGARLGIGYRYVLIDFDMLGLSDGAIGAVLAAASDAGFAGLNVTHPFKQSVIPHLDAMAPEAQAIGAVNTVVLAGGRCVGHNTDSWGFSESFRETMPGASLTHVVQFGAGGAGAAVAYALMQLGASNLRIVDREADRAEELAANMASRFAGCVLPEVDIRAALAGADGIVNATPIGMDKYPGMPFPPAYLSRKHWVSEIIYFPEETELLRQARAKGCRTSSGIGMAIYQAVRAFELFTGQQPDRRAMAAHFEAAA